MNELMIPFDEIGGEDAVRALVERFYDAMDRTETKLARMHAGDEDGRVSRETRDRFALFLIGWLGGPQDYVAEHGHPRLRWRHSRVAVDLAMRDAWMRCMNIAMDESSLNEDFRARLEARFAEVATFLINRPSS